MQSNRVSYTLTKTLMRPAEVHTLRANVSGPIASGSFYIVLLSTSRLLWGLDRRTCTVAAVFFLPSKYSAFFREDSSTIIKTLRVRAYVRTAGRDRYLEQINYAKGLQKARRQLPPLPHANYAPD